LFPLIEDSINKKRSTGEYNKIFNEWKQPTRIGKIEYYLKEEYQAREVGHLLPWYQNQGRKLSKIGVKRRIRVSFWLTRRGIKIKILLWHSNDHNSFLIVLFTFIYQPAEKALPLSVALTKSLEQSRTKLSPLLIWYKIVIPILSYSVLGSA
jgi:hypothetical protein